MTSSDFFVLIPFNPYGTSEYRIVAGLGSKFRTKNQNPGSGPLCNLRRGLPTPQKGLSLRKNEADLHSGPYKESPKTGHALN